jgi:hypothetical protein
MRQQPSKMQERDTHAEIETLGTDVRQHTSAYVSIRQHTSAYVSIRQRWALT